MKDLTLEQKYLINPFTKEINSKGFPTSTNEFKLIVGTTGLGKTYSSFNSMIPTLFEDHNLKLVIYSMPQTAMIKKIFHYIRGLRGSEKIVFSLRGGWDNYKDHQ